MLLDYKVYLMNVDLLTPSSLERIGKLVNSTVVTLTRGKLLLMSTLTGV